VYYGVKSSATEICQAATYLFAFLTRFNDLCCPLVNNRETLPVCSIPHSARFI